MPSTETKSLWGTAWQRIIRSKLNIAALGVVLLYVVVALAAHWGWLATVEHRGRGFVRAT